MYSRSSHLKRNKNGWFVNSTKSCTISDLEHGQVAYSYGAVISRDIEGIGRVINYTRYGNTTSKHQGMIANFFKYEAETIYLHITDHYSTLNNVTTKKEMLKAMYIDIAYNCFNVDFVAKHWPKEAKKYAALVEARQAHIKEQKSLHALYVKIKNFDYKTPKTFLKAFDKYNVKSNNDAIRLDLECLSKRPDLYADKTIKDFIKDAVKLYNADKRFSFDGFFRWEDTLTYDFFEFLEEVELAESYVYSELRQKMINSRENKNILLGA